MNDTKKITLATIKSFVKMNAAKLYIHNVTAFDGMEDGVRRIEGSSFHQTETPNVNKAYTWGIGAYFVGSSRDYFNVYDRIDQRSGIRYVGYEVYNCCGKFVLAVQHA
jgi:hypothetical protein